MLDRDPGQGGASLDTIFFIASKFVWLVLRPESLLTLLLCLGAVLLYRRRLRWGRRCVAIAAMAMLTIGLAPVERPVLRPLELRFPANPDPGIPAGIIVLGGAELDRISAYWGQPNVSAAGDRFLGALILANRFPEVPVVFTGGNGRLLGGVSGADLAEALFVATGLPGERLILERNSRTTAENAVMTRRMVADDAGGRWILVTSAYHMHRAVAAFCAAGWRNIVPWPVDYRTSGGDWRIDWQFAQSLGALNTGLKEWVGILGYRVTGRLELPENVPGCLADPP